MQSDRAIRVFGGGVDVGAAVKQESCDAFVIKEGRYVEGGVAASVPCVKVRALVYKPADGKNVWLKPGKGKEEVVVYLAVWITAFARFILHRSAATSSLVVRRRRIIKPY